MRNAAFQKWRAKSGGMDTSLICQMQAMEDRNRRLKPPRADLNMQADMLEDAREKSSGHPLPGRQMRAVAADQHREAARNAKARLRASVALASRAYGVGETRCRYNPKLRDENEEAADLPVGWTKA